MNYTILRPRFQGQLGGTCVAELRRSSLPDRAGRLLQLPPPATDFPKGAVIVADVVKEVMVIPDTSSGSESFPAVKGEALGPLAQITTGEESAAVLLLSNGTTAKLAANDRACSPSERA